MTVASYLYCLVLGRAVGEGAMCGRCVYACMCRHTHTGILGNDPVHGHASAHVVIDGHPVCLNRVIDSQ